MLDRLDQDHKSGACIGFQLTMQSDGKAWTAHYRHPDLTYTTATGRRPSSAVEALIEKLDGVPDTEDWGDLI